MSSVVPVDSKKELTDDELNEAVAMIAKGAEMLGFSVAIPNQDPEAEVQGMILGTEEYIDQMCSCHHKLFGDGDDKDELP